MIHYKDKFLCRTGSTPANRDNFTYEAYLGIVCEQGGPIDAPDMINMGGSVVSEFPAFNASFEYSFIPRPGY